MNHFKNLTLITLALASVAIAPISNAQSAPDSEMHHAMMAPQTSSKFKGVEVNGGTVSLSMKAGKRMLSLSKDFKIPNAPAPSWQIVDGEGNTYLLKQLKIAGGKKNLSIEVPSYIHDIAKVQIYCTFAEVVLGEATFVKMGM